MCHKCEAEREYLVTIEDLAVTCAKQGELNALIAAIACEETDMAIANHLTFLAADLGMDGDEKVEDCLIGRLYLDVLRCKAKLQ
jgi:hypothetical protein